MIVIDSASFHKQCNSAKLSEYANLGYIKELDSWKRRNKVNKLSQTISICLCLMMLPIEPIPLASIENTIRYTSLLSATGHKQIFGKVNDHRNIMMTIYLGGQSYQPSATINFTFLI